MTASIARQLALKDLYIARWPLAGGVAGGLLSIAITPLTPTAFYVGSVCFICALVILNIFVVMSGVLQEKKDNVLVFLLSLPISTSRYWVVKMMVNAALFVVPWLVLTAAAAAVLYVSDLPNGLIPFMVATAVYLLCYYTVLLAVAVTLESMAWTTAVIVAGNVSVNFFIPFVFRLPSAASASGPDAIWGRDLVTTLVVEAVVCAVAFTLAVVVQVRRRDFV